MSCRISLQATLLHNQRTFCGPRSRKRCKLLKPRWDDNTAMEKAHTTRAFTAANECAFGEGIRTAFEAKPTLVTKGPRTAWHGMENTEQTQRKKGFSHQDCYVLRAALLNAHWPNYFSCICQQGQPNAARTTQQALVWKALLCQDGCPETPRIPLSAETPVRNFACWHPLQKHTSVFWKSVISGAHFCSWKHKLLMSNAKKKKTEKGLRKKTSKADNNKRSWWKASVTWSASSSRAHVTWVNLGPCYSRHVLIKLHLPRLALNSLCLRR